MIDRRAAFRAEHADVLAFCESLGPADWRMNSRAEGWTITDVVSHMAEGCRAMFTPAVFKVLRSDDIEQTNEALVRRRRGRMPTQVFGGYRRWSRAFATSVPVLVHKPLEGVALPLGELGRYPMRLLPSALTFDHHTHLRFDIAPALGRTVPAADGNRMAAVAEWMMAVLSNQLRAAKPIWLDRALMITLTGPGGGSWRVRTSGAVDPDSSGNAACRITCAAADFPALGTRRADWRESDVSIDGDAGYAAIFLDWLNIV